MTLPVNMQIIVDSIPKDNGNDKLRWIEVKEGWLNYEHNKDKENLFERINKLNLKIHPTRLTNGLLPLVKNTDISNERQAAIQDLKYKKSEVALERIIAAKNKNIYNQLCIGNGNAESIDLIYSSDKKKKQKIIEFKTISNTPVYGMIELIKNYCLLTRFSGESETVEELIFLAPKQYYINFKNEKPIKEFFKTINAFNKENKVKFLLKYIDINDEECIEIIKNGKSNKTSDKLLIANWKSVSQPEDWLKIN